MSKDLSPEEYAEAYAADVAKKIGTTQRRVLNLFRSALNEASMLSQLIDFDPNKPFSFEDYPLTKGRSDKLIRDLQKQILSSVSSSVAYAWGKADEKNDQLEKFILGDRAKIHHRTKGLEAFTARREQGLNLSDRVWKYTEQFKEEIEMSLDLGLRDGLDAPAMSRAVREYLAEPNKLFRRVRDEHGELHLSSRAKAYHPGQGVYRSSYKNALRLTATETNMAYRTADYERIQEFDFVRGFEVCLSKNHTCNGKPFHCICDEFAGRYPKSFKFVGWHPLCRCYVKTILSDDLFDPESTPEVNDIPQGMKDWVANNGDRIDRAFNKGKPAYWIRDNAQRLLPKRYRAELKAQRKEVLAWGKQHLVGRSVTHPALPQPVTFTVGGLKEAINQPHAHYKAKNEALRHIDRLIAEGEYVGSAKDIKGRPFTFHYLKTEVGGVESYIIIREEKGSMNFYSLIEKVRGGSPEDSPGYTVRASSESHLSHNKDKKKFLLARAKARHEARTPEDVARIQARWDARAIERRRQATLARAKARHEARSATEIEAIKKRWEERHIHPALRGKSFFSNKDVDEAFGKLTSGIEGDPWFVRGGLKLTDTMKSGVNGFTYMDGRIALKPDRSAAVRSALKKIGEGNVFEITRVEADAMATLWHEITHNRNVPGNMFLSRKETDVMELMNEFVARKTLPEFYQRMGIKDIPFPEFMSDRDSTGYNQRVKSYEHIIQRFGLDTGKVLSSAKRGLFYESYKEQHDVAVSALIAGGLDKVKRLDGKILTKTQVKKLVSMCRDGYNKMRIDAYLEREGILKMD